MEHFVEAYARKKSYDKKDNSYGYLLNMSIRSFTKERIDELEKEKSRLEICHKELTQKTSRQWWRQELTELSKWI